MPKLSVPLVAVVCGAAAADATSDQLQRLHGWMVATRDRFLNGALSWEDLVAGFVVILGADWAPTGDWKRQSDELGGWPQ